MQQNEDDPVEWAGFRLPAQAAAGHFFMVGAPGSGKSLCLQGLMASVLRQIEPGTDRRAVIFDVKGTIRETIELLKARGVRCPIRNLDLFGGDRFGWDIGVDWTDKSMAGHYAALFIPDDSTDSIRFFNDAARSILKEVLVVLMLQNQSWTLADLIDITTTQERLFRILDAAPNAAAVKTRYFEPAETFANIIATLCQAMEPMREIADAAAAVPEQRRVRIGEWSKSESSILVLGANSAHTRSMATYNRLLLDTLTKHALDRPLSPSRSTTWFFWDDVRDIPDTEVLPQLLTMGRAFGVRVAFTCQDLEQLEEIYGPQKASELAGLCANRSIFRLHSATTADWARDVTSGAETFDFHPEGKMDDLIDVDLVNGIKDRRFLRPRQPCTPSEFLAFPLAKQGRVFGCHMSRAFRGAILRETTYALPAPM